MNDTINICIIGTGRMGHGHSRTFAGMDGVVLDTVVGVDADETAAFAREYVYAHAETDLAAALRRDSVDAVIICTPNALHAPQTAAALEAGKHVLCELPVAMSLVETERIAQLAVDVGKRVMICQTERFEAGKIELRRRIRAGELHPQHIDARFHLLRRGGVLTAPDRAQWQDDAIWHHGSHTVDAVLDLLGETEVRDLQVLHGPPHPALGVPIDWNLHWRTPGGVLVGVSLSHNADWHVHDYRLICEEGTLVCEWGTLRNAEGVLLDARELPRSRDLQDGEFIAAIREGRPPAVDVDAVWPAVRVLQSAWDVWHRGM